MVLFVLYYYFSVNIIHSYFNSPGVVCTLELQINLHIQGVFLFLFSKYHLAFGLIICLLLLFTRRPQVLLVIALPLMVGIVFTLAATSLFIGRINMVSGFMIPALAGLGVDFCIHLYRTTLKIQ